MTREQLKEMGLTDEQIEKVIAENSKDVQKANTRADKYKADAEKAVELQTRIDEIESQNLSDVEKANKALENANARIAELEKKDAVAAKKSQAMSNFNITSEQADTIIDSDGNLDYEKLGKIISDKETASANAKEQELAGKAKNPNGGSNKDDKEKTTAEKLVEKINGTNNEGGENNVLSHYI